MNTLERLQELVTCAREAWLIWDNRPYAREVSSMDTVHWMMAYDKAMNDLGAAMNNLGTALLLVGVDLRTPKRGDERRIWVTLEALPPGAVFVTEDGVLAVKSEYHYMNGDQWQCVLLTSGEYAHFARGNNTLVSAVEVRG